MTTHDYTRRCWGHDYVIHEVVDGGQRLEMSGWGQGIKKGDYLIIPNNDGPLGSNNTTRYRVQKIEYKMDPRDMWFATTKFAPRKVVPV